MQFTLLFFILLPLVEIYLMIKIGSVIGAFNTISITILTAIVGVYFAKLQGLSTLRSLAKNIRINKSSIGEIINGFCLVVAAILLILPGFLTDFLGFLLLVPFSRNIILENFFTQPKNSKIDIIEINPEEIEEHDKFK
ncbi:MAG: FxsA family protein [Proteobacteria bacterium]|jgi:UPF0716 protein FxsA|nr:FxsA family protein [Pseudomonadota bacterium]MDA0971594.1 FxsA family protein [Pseudomonadota bacterium]